MNKLFITLAALLGLAVGGGAIHVVERAGHEREVSNLIKQHKDAIASFKCAPTSYVRLAPDFDVTKLNNKRGEFTYAPSSTFTNVTIVVDKSDTTLLRQATTKKE